MGVSAAQNLDFKHPKKLLSQAEKLSLAGKITESRRVIVAWLETIPPQTQCLKYPPTVNHFSAIYFFPKGKATEFAVYRGDFVRFMKLSQGAVQITYEALYGQHLNMKIGKLDNAVIKFIDRIQANWKVVEQCGHLPKLKVSYSFFDSQQPPGIVDYGVISSDGSSRIVGTRSLEHLPYSVPIVAAP
jgi:hypothetical protein